VNDYFVSRQDPEQVLERPAFDGMIGREQRHDGAGDVTGKVAERGTNEQLFQLLTIQRGSNEFAHDMLLGVVTGSELITVGRSRLPC
jgi:hypothetical protein